MNTKAVFSIIKKYLLMFPILYIAIFYSFVLRARILLKVWPTPYNPDPKSLGFHIHQVLIFLFLYLALASIPLLIYWVVFLSRPMLKNKMNIFVVSLSWAALFILVYLDLFRFFYWFFD